MSRAPAYSSACVLAAAVLWGTTGTAAALAPGVGSLAVGAAAMGVGGLLQALAALRVVRVHRAGLAARWRTLAVAAGAVAVYPLAFYSSMRLAGVAVGTVVSIGSAPVAAAVIERVADRQPLSRRWALGAAAALLGVVALAISRTGHAEAASGSSVGRPVLGVALGLLAGVTYALYSWGAARMMRSGLPSRPVMGAIFGLGGVLLIPVLLFTGAPIVETGRNLAVVAYLAVVPMFVGYVLFGRGLAAVSATTATTLSLLEPAVAAVVAVVVLHEQLPALGWAGMAVLLAGMVLLTADSRRQTSIDGQGDTGWACCSDSGTARHVRRPHREPLGGAPRAGGDVGGDVADQRGELGAVPGAGGDQRDAVGAVDDEVLVRRAGEQTGRLGVGLGDESGQVLPDVVDDPGAVRRVDDTVLVGGGARSSARRGTRRSSARGTRRRGHRAGRRSGWRELLWMNVGQEPATSVPVGEVEGVLLADLQRR